MAHRHDADGEAEGAKKGCGCSIMFKVVGAIKVKKNQVYNLDIETTMKIVEAMHRNAHVITRNEAEADDSLDRFEVAGHGSLLACGLGSKIVPDADADKFEQKGGYKRAASAGGRTLFLHSQHIIPEQTFLVNMMVAQNDRHLDKTAVLNAVARLNDFATFDPTKMAPDQFKKCLATFGAGFLQLERSILVHEGHVAPHHRENLVKGNHWLNKAGCWGKNAKGVLQRPIFNAALYDRYLKTRLALIADVMRRFGPNIFESAWGRAKSWVYEYYATWIRQLPPSERATISRDVLALSLIHI